MKIKNLTPHAICIFTTSQCVEQKKGNYTTLVLKEGEKPVLTIEAEKEIARVSSKTIYTDPVEFNGVSIPQAKVVFGEVEGLPVNLEEDTLYIVSSITVNAFKAHGHDTKQLRLVADTVRNEQGQIVGALSLAEV
ncbi:MAG: hypothetical protein U0M61_06910 [Succinivibrio sp.]|nr:hypothetical protein [Succinivibrio sp.]